MHNCATKQVKMLDRIAWFVSFCTFFSPAKYAVEKTAFLALYGYVLLLTKKTSFYIVFQVPCILILLLGCFFELLHLSILESSNNVMETWMKIEKIRSQQSLSAYLQSVITLHGGQWLSLLSKDEHNSNS